MALRIIVWKFKEIHPNVCLIEGFEAQFNGFLYKFEVKIKSVKKKFYYKILFNENFYQDFRTYCDVAFQFFLKHIDRICILWSDVSVQSPAFQNVDICTISCTFMKYKVFINEIIARSTCNLLVLQKHSWKHLNILRENYPDIIVLQFELVKFFIFFLPILLLYTHNNAKPRHLKVPLKFAYLV